MSFTTARRIETDKTYLNVTIGVMSNTAQLTDDEVLALYSDLEIIAVEIRRHRAEKAAGETCANCGASMGQAYIPESHQDKLCIKCYLAVLQGEKLTLELRQRAAACADYHDCICIHHPGDSDRCPVHAKAGAKC